jgi:hypothetical protein
MLALSGHRSCTGRLQYTNPRSLVLARLDLSQVVLAVVDVGEYEKLHNCPWKELLSLEVVGERLPALLEGLEHAALACVVAAEDMRGGKDVEGERVFITQVKGTFFGMSESEEASKMR